MRGPITINKCYNAKNIKLFIRFTQSIETPVITAIAGVCYNMEKRRKCDLISTGIRLMDII